MNKKYMNYANVKNKLKNEYKICGSDINLNTQSPI